MPENAGRGDSGIGSDPTTSIRDAEPEDVGRIVDYFHDADPELLVRMGVAVEKLPPRDEWIGSILGEMGKPLQLRNGHFLIWQVDGLAAGHSGVTDIKYGRNAFMHLHLWDAELQRRGLGTRLVAASAIRYCELFRLEDLFCEPKADNTAPNRALQKAGFEFVKTHSPEPGYINFPQELNRWRYRCDADKAATARH